MSTHIEMAVKHHTIIQAAFVCLSVCSLSPPRSFDRSSPNLVGVCRWTSELPLRGSFSKRSTGHFRFPLYYICASLTPHSCKGRLLLRCMSTAYVGGPRNCYWGVLFLKVNGSTGHFHFHYIIYDSRRRQAHATPLQKTHGVWWHQAHATPLQKAHSIFCSLDR